MTFWEIVRDKEKRFNVIFKRDSSDLWCYLEPNMKSDMVFQYNTQCRQRGATLMMLGQEDLLADDWRYYTEEDR